MFALPCLFSFLVRDTQQMKLIQLLKQFERPASLGMAVQDWPLVANSLLSRHKKEVQRELLFTENGVNVFKMEPMPTVEKNGLQKLSWIFTSKDQTVCDEKQFHFILEATSIDQITEKDIRKLMETSAVPNILAWTMSQSVVTLLMSSTMEGYASFGSAFIRKNIETLFQFGVQHIYPVEYHIMSPTAVKPPNVLIYTGDDYEQSDHDKFKKTKDVLGQCLHRDKYVIYQLQHNHILTHPWKENTSLLVLATDQKLEQPLKDTIDDYVQNGGRLLSVCSEYTLGATTQSAGVKMVFQDVNMCTNFDSSVKTLHVNCLDAVFEVEERDGVTVLALASLTSQAVIVSVLHGAGMALLSLANIFLDGLEVGSGSDCKREQFLKDLLNYLGLTCSDPKKSVLTNAYLFGSTEDKKTFLESVKDVLEDGRFKGNDISLFFSDHDDEEMHPSPDFLPIITHPATTELALFSFASYKDFLETKQLGQLVVYSEVITSTQTVLDGSSKLIQRLPEECGLLVVGRQQTLGKGRGGNDWLSPDGCLSFSFSVKVDLDSQLGSHLPFLQHIAALAVVEAVRSLKNYEDVELHVKWPNDIYFQRDTKIGGILVNSSIQGKTLHAVVGIGVNLDNSEPTTCINDIILQREDQLYGQKLKKLSREQLLARILNAMERFMEDFQLNGPKNILTKYYNRWLHSAARVRLESLNGEEVTVKGLDDMGFLSVVTGSNEVISVQPDGNSFDMMRNLIAIKTRK